MKKIFRQPTGEYCTLSKRCSRKKVNTSGKCLSYSSFCDKAIEWFPISFFLPQKMFPFRMRKGCIFLHLSSQDGNSWCFEDAECASKKCFVSSCTFLEAGIDNTNPGRLDTKIWSSLADYTCVMALAVTGNRAHENKGPVCSNTCTNSSTKMTEAHITWEEAKNGEGHSFAQAVAYIW